MSIQSRPARSKSKSASPSWQERAGSPSNLRIAMIVFIAAAFLMGGGARGDILSLVLLRPLACAVAAYALLNARAGDLNAFRAPLMFLGLLALLITFQLVPLPFSVWSRLPERELLVRLFGAAGFGTPWLPLALSSSRALNSLLALTVPTAALLLFAVQRDDARRDFLNVVWVCIVASCLLGIAQLLRGTGSSLYLYRITNDGLPVGLFANRNHQGLAIAMGILLSAYRIALVLRRPRYSWLSLAISGGALFLFIPFLFVAGSRAGLLLGTAMLGPSAYLILHALNARSRSAGRSLWKNNQFRVGLVLVAAGVVALFLAAILFSRSLAFDRLMTKDIEFDLRAAALPTILSMLAHNWLFGIGFGAFDIAFMRDEPLALLRPSYLNHAHNDWIEFALEGGLAATLLLAAGVVWIANRAFRSVILRGPDASYERFAATGIVVAFGLASLVDYPCRVPSLAILFTLACAILSAPRVSRN